MGCPLGATPEGFQARPAHDPVPLRMRPRVPLQIAGPNEDGALAARDDAGWYRCRHVRFRGLVGVDQMQRLVVHDGEVYAVLPVGATRCTRSLPL